MTINAEAVTWLESLSRHLTGVDEYRFRVEPMLASKFNVLKYARTDEYGLSLILADLLDPGGSHGQGDRLLACFLDRFWRDNPNISGSVTVRTEVATDRIAQSQRRLDIQVDLSDRILAIENKPWAADQPNQIRHYLQHLGRSGRPFRLIYLAGQLGRQPSEVSIERELRTEHGALGRFEEISYHDVRQWIRDCLGCCENERVAMFLRDLDRFVSENFAALPEDFTSKLIIDAALNSAEGIKAFFESSCLAQDIRRILLERLENQVRAEFTNKESKPWREGWKLTISGPLDQKLAGIEVARHADSALRVQFEFGGINCSSFSYGVSRRSVSDIAPRQNLKSCLDEAIGHRKADSEWWCWSRWFEPRHWGNDRGIWAGVTNGTMARTITDRLDEVLKLVQDSKLIAHFDERTVGSAAPVVAGSTYQIPAAARDICAKPDGKLVDLVLAIESSNWQLRRILGRRVATELKGIVENEPRFAGWEIAIDDDLTGKYHGFVLRPPGRKNVDVSVEFQQYGCRDAIFGLKIEGQAGQSEEAQKLRNRLTEAGLERGKNSPSWVWYRPLKPANWFEQPDAAVAVYDGSVARSIADAVGTVIRAFEAAN